VQGERQPPRSTTRALVDITHLMRQTTMGYINDFRAKLIELIEDGRTEDAVKFAADKVLESYRNGADMIGRADPAAVPHASTSRGERKADRFVRRTTHNVPPGRREGRHYQS
jgi:hypothetical protein